MSEMQIVEMNLSDLVPDPENPRVHDERNLDAIVASLKEHGQVEPLLIQKSTNMVIAGNGRREAMTKLGWTKATVAVVDVDDKAARRLSIALNRSGELAGWDDGILAKHLQSLNEFGADDAWLDGLGFNESEMNDLVNSFGEVVAELSMAPPDVPEPAEADGLEVEADPTNDGTMAPAPMPTSGVRMVQLFLTDETIEPFQIAVRKLAKLWGTDNVTDTVEKAVNSHPALNTEAD